MKINWRTFLLIMLTLASCAPQTSVYKRRGITNDLLKKITIGIVDVSGYESALAESKIAEQFMQREIRIIERVRIFRILQEHSFQQTGLIDNSTAIEIGKIIGVSAVFIGSVSTPSFSNIANFHDNTWSSYTVTFTGRLISTKTGEILLSGSASGKRGFPNFAAIDSIDKFFRKVFND